jgi:hypothetical protein
LLKISEVRRRRRVRHKIIFVERPAHLLRNLGALLAAVADLSPACPFGGSDAQCAGEQRSRGAPVGLLLTLAAATLQGSRSAKRHVTFYRDESKRERLLGILQDKKFQPITMTYTLRDARGRPIARLGKNWLFNVIRNAGTWAPGPDRRLPFVAKEDSIILSLLRRFLGPLFGLLRTNFVFLPAGTGDVIGEFAGSSRSRPLRAGHERRSAAAHGPAHRNRARRDARYRRRR